MHLVMDRAYEGNETLQLALDLGFITVATPMLTRIEPWEHDREMYKRRNEVERLFRGLKGYSCIFLQIEKLDLMCLGFISFVLVANGLGMRKQTLADVVSEALPSTCRVKRFSSILSSLVYTLDMR